MHGSNRVCQVSPEPAAEIQEDFSREARLGRAGRKSWAEKLTECVHRTGRRLPEAKKLRQGSDHRRFTRTDREVRREPSSSRITSGPRLASGTGPVPPDSISQQRPRRRSRALWSAAHPAPGPSPRACCLPRTHCPRELRRLAWNNAAVQKRRPTTLEFPGCPTDYFRSLVPTPPLAPTPEPPATSPRPCTRASGGCGISSHWVTCLFQLLGHTLAPPRLFLPARPQAFTSHTTLGRLNRSLSDAWHFEMTGFQKLDTTSQKAFPISPLLWPPVDLGPSQVARHSRCHTERNHLWTGSSETNLSHPGLPTPSMLQMPIICVIY
ncbi:hypothetical protein MJT46_012719 [Ovis ammon polii x Ovis aries]|nr:hypothetical protein MJT46_012719 [Ovis ammon polii x Ovis aries]